jgi:flagellar assembly factor FliW
VKIKTSRFGELDIDSEALITMPGGLIGFPREERYLIVRHNPDSPFYWLQAVDNPDLAFVVVDPQVFKPDYQVALGPQVLEALEAKKEDEVGIFVIVTIPPGDPQGMTANLLGPLAINRQTRLARQLVLDERRFSHRHRIIPEAEGHPET